MKENAPYGTWPSCITGTMVANGSPKRFDTSIDHATGRVFWCESIAAEKGRSAIMMHDGKEHQCVLPRPLSAKSKVHEYGGAAYCIDGDLLYFVLSDDQRIYQVNIKKTLFEPKALSPKGGKRYADLVIDKNHQRIIAVCEHHQSNEVLNSLVAVSTDDEQLTPLASGHDFFANPRVSPDGKNLIWITWDHPDMPWDNSTLWHGKLNENGLSDIQPIAGKLFNGVEESICQPTWSPGGDIIFVSDRNNWWNLHSIPFASIDDASTEIKTICLYEKHAEFATPQWVFGMASYGFLDASTILASYTEEGVWKLATISLGETNSFNEVPTELSSIHNVQCHNGRAVFIGASASKPNAVYVYENERLSLLSDLETPVSEAEFSQPQSISFPTSHNENAHALFYPPNNSKLKSEEGLPPLIVICHGGPTAATEASLNFKIQYWTNRGFAVADVNYRGSTGYGRKYRQRLNKQWGVLDVDDVCAVVEHLAKQSLIDNNRCVIKGSSAGGYTVLAALAFRDTFCAGVDIYGIGDLEMLATDTHKFEARYLDSLVGDYPEEKEVYYARSPIHSVDTINCPLLIFQGLKDKVVPPQQADEVYKAVKQKGIPVAYVRYPEEAHGFRQAETIEHMLDSELQFYARIFDFEYLGDSKPLAIENLTIEKKG